jgi:hypothetical protein
MFETEHVGLDDPGARRHPVEPEGTVIVGKGEQASIALGGADARAGNSLTTGLNCSGLCKCKWQAHCQKHENFEH